MAVRSWARVLWMLALLGASGAWAQQQLDGGWVASGSGSGFVLGPRYPTVFPGRALYLDAQGRLLVQPLAGPGQTTANVKCYDLASGQDLGPAIDFYPATSYSFSYAAGAGPNRTDIVAVVWGNAEYTNLQFVRGGCGTSPRQPLGGFAVTPAERVAAASVQTPLPLLGNGDLIYPTEGGELVRAAFGSGTAVRSTVIGRAAMDALLGPVGLSNGDGGTRPAGLSYPALAALANDT